jgi:hypothetical protein
MNEGEKEGRRLGRTWKASGSPMAETAPDGEVAGRLRRQARTRMARWPMFAVFPRGSFAAALGQGS